MIKFFFFNRSAQIMFVVGIQRLQTVTAEWPPAQNRPQQRRRAERSQQNTITADKIERLEDVEA